MKCLESVVSDKSISEHLVLRLVIWKDMESLTLEIWKIIWKLEIQSDKACKKKNMDLLDMDRSQMGCLNGKMLLRGMS